MADSTGFADSVPQAEKGWPALKQHIIQNKVKVGLWVTRFFTIIFTIGYIIPIFGYVRYIDFMYYIDIVCYMIY